MAIASDVEVSGPNKIKVRQVHQIVAQREYVDIGQPSALTEFCYFERATRFAQAVFCPFRWSRLSRFSPFHGVTVRTPSHGVRTMGWAPLKPNIDSIRSIYADVDGRRTI